MKTISLLLFVVVYNSLAAQNSKDITRIEFNSGTRAYREQIIFTKDSVLVIKEDFRRDDKPGIEKRKANDKDWNKLVSTLNDIALEEISALKSPTMNRASDAAAHGSIIITTSDSTSYTHAFDDENPHQKFQPLMKQIKNLVGKGRHK